jgi:hypothetical protein
LKDTVLTGDARFLDKLTADHVNKDLVNYDHVQRALNANPKWMNDVSVPKTGDPFTRTEVFEL